MTTIERPYWPHSDPEPPEVTGADLSAQPVYTASPLSQCLNGCQDRTQPATAVVLCEPDQRLCTRCRKTLDRWLRDLPGNYGLLLWVKDHGTVPSDPGTKHTKRPDPPAPGRLEVTDLLDDRPIWTHDDNGVLIRTENRRGALGIVHDWARRIRRDRLIQTRCGRCNHETGRHKWAPPLRAHCRSPHCNCRHYEVIQPTVSAECSVILTNLAWCTQQEWAGELYEEIRVLARTLSDTVGEYRPKPVGKCAALRDVPDSTVQVLCGGALVMDKPTPEDEDQTTSVKCLSCGRRHEANSGLRALGLIVGAMFGENRIDQEAS